MTTTDTQRTGPEPKCASCGHGTLSHNAIGGACTKCECGHFKPVKNEARCLAPNCGRKLTSPASIVRGLGGGCYRKLRAAFRTADLSQWTPAQVAEAMQAIEDGAVVPSNREGVYHVVSTDGSEVHLVHRDGCNCTNGLQNKPPRPCWHRCAVAIITATAARPAQSRTAFRTAA